MKISESRKVPRLPAIMALAGTLALSGCLTPPDKETEPASVGTQGGTPVDGFKVLEGMGFARDRIAEKESGYIVDGDMYFAREDLAHVLPLAKNAQRRSTAITTPNPSTLRLAIHSSMSDYATVIHQAVNVLNSLKTRLHIEIVASGQNITVYSDVSTSCPSDMRNLGSNTHAVGRLASGGNPGGQICVNRDNSDMLAGERNRVSVMAHEIGHTIGFYHTGSTDGTHITGTATTDANSLMGPNGTVAQGILTLNDVLAMELLYPSDKPLGGTNLDQDKKDDLVVWRPSDGNWFALRSNSGFTAGTYWQWGQRGDMPLEDTDIDGDSLDDMVVWRPSDGTFYARTSKSSYANWVSYPWGQRGDVPIPNHDMDGDGKDDLVVWRWTDGTFYVKTSKSGFATGTWYGWGRTGDVPVGGIDADKDGKDDWVFWRATEGRFYVEYSATGFTTASWYGWGDVGDIPVGSTDLDRDKRDDVMVFRPSNGTWYALTSSSNLASSLSLQYGQRGDIPLMGTDIDQDGKRDIILWRPSNATFYIRKSNSNFTTSVSYSWGI